MNQQSPARGLPEHSHPSQPVASESEGLPSPKISFELPAFSLFASGQIGREETERFIDQQFFKSYGAQHSEYMPWLISMRQQGQLSACAGVAFAVDKNPLFLERYLPSSIESLVSKNCGCQLPVGRSLRLAILQAQVSAVNISARVDCSISFLPRFLKR